MGAVNEDGNVDLDTGAVIFGSGLLKALYGLITTNRQGPTMRSFVSLLQRGGEDQFLRRFSVSAGRVTLHLEDFYRRSSERQHE